MWLLCCLKMCLHMIIWRKLWIVWKLIGLFLWDVLYGMRCQKCLCQEVFNILSGSCILQISTICVSFVDSLHYWLGHVCLFYQDTHDTKRCLFITFITVAHRQDGSNSLHEFYILHGTGPCISSSQLLQYTGTSSWSLSKLNIFT